MRFTEIIENSETYCVILQELVPHLKTLSTLEQWFTGVRLLGSYLTSLSRLFPRRSRQRLWTDAAEGD